MRAFTQLREMLSTHEGLKKKIEAMERKYDRQFKVVFDAIKQLLETEKKPKRKIGFDIKEPKAKYGKKKQLKGSKSQRQAWPYTKKTINLIVEAQRRRIDVDKLLETILCPEIVHKNR